MNFYDWLKTTRRGTATAHDDSILPPHPDGRPCHARSREACPIYRMERLLDEADRLDPNAGEGFFSGRLCDECREVEARYTKEDGTKCRAWMRAPNGRPTNLTERQWLLVRTASFKLWFGDWEKNANIDRLVMEPTLHLDWHDQFNLNQEDARKWLLSNIRGQVTNEGTGEVISIARDAIRKVTSHGIHNEVHLKSTAAIPMLIQKATYVCESESTDPKGKRKFDKYRYFVAGIEIDKIPYTVKMVIGVKNGVSYYDHNLTQIEKGTLVEALNEVNDLVACKSSLRGKYDTKLLDVLQRPNFSKIIDENGEPLVVYHGTRADEIITEFRPCFFAGGEDGHATAKSFATDPMLTRGDGLPRVYAVFLNLRNPFVYDNRGNAWDYVALTDAMLRDGVPYDPEKDFTDGGRTFHYAKSDDVVAWAKTKNHDGMVIRNVEENDGMNVAAIVDAYVAFSANKIRWADSPSVVSDD